MSDYMHLIGADDVRSADHKMQSAASEMTSAASSFECSLHQHRQFLDDWLMRLEHMLSSLNEKEK